MDKLRASATRLSGLLHLSEPVAQSSLVVTSAQTPSARHRRQGDFRLAWMRNATWCCVSRPGPTPTITLLCGGHNDRGARGICATGSSGSGCPLGLFGGRSRGCFRATHSAPDAANSLPEAGGAYPRGPRPQSVTAVPLEARSGSLMKSGPTPAFVLARVCAPAAQAWLPVSAGGSVESTRRWSRGCRCRGTAAASPRVPRGPRSSSLTRGMVSEHGGARWGGCRVAGGAFSAGRGARE